MELQQISVFVENRAGRLADITEILAAHKIDIRALSIADTTDYGILRLIVNDPGGAVAALKQAGLTASATQVLAICVPDVPGGFAKAMRLLAGAGISVEYAYAFLTPEAGNAYVILRVEDQAAAESALAANGERLRVFDSALEPAVPRTRGNKLRKIYVVVIAHPLHL